MSRRKNHAPAFKAKVALIALSGDKSIAELSSEFGVHQTLIHKWVKQFKESAAGIFAGESAINLTLMQEIDRVFTEWPFLGVRQMCRYPESLVYGVGRKRVRRLMRLMGLAVPLPVARSDYRPEQSGLVLGYTVHTHA